MSNQTLAALKALGGALSDPADLKPYLTDSRHLLQGNTPVVLRPSDTQQVAEIVKLCASAGISISIAGGRTGLAGGGVPPADGTGIVLSLERMNRIRSIDALDNSMIVEAGCILANVQAAAEEADRLFPLRLNAEGSCTIGGNISTNAGGIQVLRYGTMRDLVLGLEVVLPSGEIWNGLRALRKDNTGYALKHLFIGAEGTLGIVTAAVLQTLPQPNRHPNCIPGPEQRMQDAVKLLSRPAGIARQPTHRLRTHAALRCGKRRSAHRSHRPLRRTPPTWYVLLELSGSTAVQNALLDALGSHLESGTIADAIVAESLTQAATLWRLRESTWQGQIGECVTIRHDVAVPISAIPTFIDRATEACATIAPNARPYVFGHIGDGNIHFNIAHADTFPDPHHQPRHPRHSRKPRRQHQRRTRHRPPQT